MIAARLALSGCVRCLSLFAAALLAVCLPAHAVNAAVVASVDRTDVELNESFTLAVTVNTAIDTEPESAPLLNDFYIVSRSTVSNTTIVNSEISRSRTWTYVLMAKEAGEFVIPPLTVGNEKSNPVRITISPVAQTLPGKSDIFVVTEVDRQETFVQAQLLYTVKVYRAVATRQPRLSEPDISGVDVLVELAADDRSYDSLIDGKNYNVVERVYALFPQASGEVSIAPALFEARVLRNGRITGLKVFKSNAIDIAVKPIPPPPDDFPDAAWFPAKSVELTEEWSREPGSLRAGEPITRRITVTASGQLSTQIPVIEPVEPDGIKVYPDKPELRVSTGPAGILATRTDQYALIAVGPGDIRLPAQSLPWWNIEEGAWQVASLPEHTLEILPSADVLPKPAAATAAAADGEAVDGTLVLHSTFWRHVSELLACLWILTLLVGWWLRREAETPAKPAIKEQKTPSLRKQRSMFIKAARLAAKNGDAEEVKSALCRWGRLQWPENAPRSIGEIAARVPEPLSTELETLSQVSYGPGRESWDGAGLAAALGSVKASVSDREAENADRLPPLMPQT